MRVCCALVEFCECSFRLLLCLVVVALCWLGASRVYGQLLVSWGKELNCPSDRNQGAWIASAFFADSLMQAMLGVEGAVINISNLLLIAPAGHLDAASEAATS